MCESISRSVTSGSETLWTIASQAPLSVEFSRQEYWSGQPFPPRGSLPNLGLEHRSPPWQADSLLSEPLGKPSFMCTSFQRSLTCSDRELSWWNSSYLPAHFSVWHHGGQAPGCAGSGFPPRHLGLSANGSPEPAQPLGDKRAYMSPRGWLLNSTRLYRLRVPLWGTERLHTRVPGREAGESQGQGRQAGEGNKGKARKGKL